MGVSVFTVVNGPENVCVVLFTSLTISHTDSGRNLRSSSLSVPILRPSSALSTHSSPATHSPPSPVPSLSVTGSVSSSLTRRIQRYRATSLEDPAELYRKVLKPLDRVYNECLHSSLPVFSCV